MRIINRIGELLAVIGGLVLLFCASITLCSVIGRNLFNSPISGDFELIEYGVAIAIFSFVPYLMSQNGNIIMQLPTAKLPRSYKYLLDQFALVLFAAVYGALSIYGARGAYEAFIYHEQSQILGLPIWLGIFYASLCLGFSTISCIVVFMGKHKLHQLRS